MEGRVRRLVVLGCASALLASAAVLLPPVAAHVVVAGASATDEAPSVYVDPAHDSRQAGDPLTPGLARKWSQHFDNWVSYPVVYGGVAYFTVAGPASGSTAPGTRRGHRSLACRGRQMTSTESLTSTKRFRRERLRR